MYFLLLKFNNGNFNGQTLGTTAGIKFKNSDNQLPKVDSKANPITYREFDVNNKIVGQVRDAERLIRESELYKQSLPNIHKIN